MGNEASGNLSSNERHALLTPNLKEKLDICFEQLDDDGNEQLSKVEIISAFQKAEKSSNEASMFFKLMDTNGDQQISRQEFYNFWIILRVQGSTEQDVIAKMEDFLGKFKQVN